MKLHRFEIEIVKYVLEHAEVRWSQLKEDLVEKGVMAQGTLSKYLQSLQPRIIKKKFGDEGHPIYYVPEKIKKKLRELTKASLSPEERIKMWEAFTRKFLYMSLEELTELGEAIRKKRGEKRIEEEREALLKDQKEKEEIIKRLKKEGKV